MSVPASVVSDLSALASACDDAAPLAAAGRSTVLALRYQASSLVSSLDTVVSAGAPALDGFAAPSDPTLMPAAVLQIVGQAQDQCVECDIRGLVGRVLSNLEQVVVT